MAERVMVRRNGKTGRFWIRRIAGVLDWRASGVGWRTDRLAGFRRTAGRTAGRTALRAARRDAGGAASRTAGQAAGRMAGHSAGRAAASLDGRHLAAAWLL